MNFKVRGTLSVLLVMTLLLAGCSSQGKNTGSTDGRMSVVATTTMLADLAQVIGGERTHVNGLMGPGIDPHLYQASAGDVALMQGADVLVYNGLHLEGKMADIFENLAKQGQDIIGVADNLDEALLLKSEDDSGVYDPHIWFDVSLWKEAAKLVAAGLTKADPGGKDHYEANLASYLQELDETDQYIKRRAAELTEDQRVLVTAHDAFQYFGKAYGFEVRGLQGTSTDAEAGTMDVSNLATFIVERQIKAVFVESSVPAKTIEALQAAVRARGFDVSIGGELYSDSLGDAQAGTDTYILTIKSNVDTIVDALK